ncbi:group I truncated hemoglobin [Hymenobacter latericus]|uniref:group I truncated hemoglobin n=1 Tax=Hymenobacter sp. YIM 151858-1 TaxID=2987688 RepID=UPI0022278EF0|nr:group 1 truncated hemoglobin [Hymenobacter sp. YIM 151858-1]UYZ58296.1 group 1 truncated hemoglobin [Hymenobacter sp. YIM 151858-1]
MQKKYYQASRFIALLLLGASLTATTASCGEQEKAPEPTLYDRVGKVDGISKLVDKFMANVVAECASPNSVLLRSHTAFLADVSAGNDARRLAFRNNLIDQLGQISGGPLVYRGKNMVAAHIGMKITNAEFDAVAAELTKAMNTQQIKPADQEQLLGLLGAMRGDIVGK